MVELGGGFRFCARNGEETRVDSTGGDAGKSAGHEQRVDRRCRVRVDARTILRAEVLLFGGGIIEGAILHDGAPERNSGTIAAQRGLSRFRLERVTGERRIKRSS